MKGILPIWIGRFNKTLSRKNRATSRKRRMEPKIVSLEDRLVLTTTTSYFMPSPYASGAYLPVGQVDRVRISFLNQDHPDWVIDPSSFSPADISITRNGGTAIDLSNGAPGEYKIGVVGSETNQNTFWLIGLPRVALATGDYTISVTGAVNYLEAPGTTTVVSTETPTGSQAWTQRSGTAAAWGSNINNQSTIPTGLANVVSVAAGGDFSLALKSDGTVAAWGTGTGSTNLPSSLTNPATANVVQIAAGNLFGMALKADGSIISWGTNGSYNVVNNTPIASAGNFFSISAGYATGFAIGDTFATAPLDTIGTDGTLVTWGSATSFGESLYVQPDTIQGLVQISGGGDFMTGVRADGSFYGLGALPESPINTNDPSITYVQAVAGAKLTGGSQKFSLLLSNDYSSPGWNPSGSAGTVTGWGSNTYGQVDPATATNPAYTSNIPVPFNLSQISRLNAGDLHVIALNSNNNSIKVWGYNGGATPDDRVTGGLAYTANATVGGVAAGATNSVVQVMDLTLPTITRADIVPQAPLTTNSFPLKFRATFSEPINLTTLSTSNFAVTNDAANGSIPYVGFPITGLSLVSSTTSTYEVTVGTSSTTPPANFDSMVYLTLSNPNPLTGTVIRDLNGNALVTGNTTSLTGIDVVSNGLTTTAGTFFNDMQWVTPGVINFTLSFAQDVSVAQATNLANYAFTTVTGTLASPSVISVTATPTPSASVSKAFTIQVVTGNPTPTNSAADFKLYLKPNTVQIPAGSGTWNTQVDSNTVRVDNITPVISSVLPSTSSGATPTTTIVTGATGATVYFKVSFNDAVSFSGASSSIANYFSFTKGTYADPAKTLSAYVGTVTNATNAAYSNTWIVQVAAVGQGTLGMTVNPSYTSGSTYSIVNPVNASPSASASSSATAWTILTNVYSTTIVNGPTGLNPSNTDPVPSYINPLTPSYNSVQRSQIHLLQFNFSVPVANNGSALTSGSFKLQKWNGTAYVDDSSTNVVLDSVANPGGTGYYATYNLSFVPVTSSPEANWSLSNGYYQVVLTTPSTIKDANSVTYATGPSSWSTAAEFYRMFGDANGNGEIDNDDVNKTVVAFNNGNDAWASWSFLSMANWDPTFPMLINLDVNTVIVAFNRGEHLEGRNIVFWS